MAAVSGPDLEVEERRAYGYLSPMANYFGVARFLGAFPLKAEDKTITTFR